MPVEMMTYGRPSRSPENLSRSRQGACQAAPIASGAIELFSAAVQRGNSDPRYQWAALNAFSHYLLGQYDASLSWAREALYVNPNHLQVLAVRSAALAQSGRTEEAAKAVEVLLSSFPGFTVERHLRNFRWKTLADIAHYRDGLLKAHLPSTKLTLVESGSRRTANS